MTATQDPEPDLPDDHGRMRSGASPKAPLWRRILATILGVIAIVALIASLIMAWQRTAIQDEDQFVAALADIPSDDAVATVVSDRVAVRIVERAGVNDFVVRVLPDGLEFLALPLTGTLTNVVSDATYEVLVSDAFTTVWEATLRVTHRSIVVLLSGNDRALVSEDGAVSIDLNAIADLAAARLESRGLTLPNLDVEFGEIVIYESDQLGAAQAAAESLRTLGWLIPLAAILLVAVSLWAAPDRRRMTSFLGFGTAIAVLISLALVRTARGFVLGGAQDETGRQARSVVWDALTDLFVQMAWAAFVLALIVGFAAWVFGPSRRAVRVKTGVTGLVARWGEPEDSEPSAVSRFFDEWLRTIEVAIIVLATLFVLWGPPPTVLTVIVTTLLAIGLIVIAEVIAGPNHSSSDVDVEVDA